MKSVMGIPMLILASFICVRLLSALLRFLHEAWWTPIRVQHLMRSQGIGGPPSRFIYGNTKELLKMRSEALSKPMSDISHDIVSRIHPFISSWTNKSGMSFLFWVGPRAQLVVSEPEMIKEILNDREEVYPKAESQVLLKKIFGDGLVASGGEKWYKMRKLANFAFHGENLKNMVPAMVASVEMMLAKWEKHCGNEIDVYEEFRFLTSEVISRTAFGSSYLEGKDIFDELSKLQMLSVKNGFKVRLPGISWIVRNGDEIEAEKLEKGIHQSILKLVKKREENALREGIDNYGFDFLGLLVEAYHDADESKRISIQDIIDECKTFYFAGQETTNALLAWSMLLLAVHTDWQEKARNEVLKTFGQQTLSPDGIPKLKIVGMIINETLRLYPPANAVARKVGREVRLRKLTLPSNMTVFMSILAAHHDPDTWGKDVHDFKPERFEEGIAKATDSNPAAYFPFGLGPRTCVGFNFAITEAKIALSMILQRYTFTLSPAYVHSPAPILILRPQYGVQVMLSPLHSESQEFLVKCARFGQLEYFRTHID